jgi:dTDP-4-dehydrorhamnose reductase
VRVAWITGAGGLIGSPIVRATAGQCRARAVYRDELDLTDFARVAAHFSRERPQLVIHCAAVSSIAECEANPTLAWKINVEATQHLAELASDIPLIFFSTDLVFDGCKGNYNESDAPNPVSFYAETKVAAERIVLLNPKHIVVRTALTAGISPRGNRAFNEQLRLAWERGETTRLFVDEFRSPIAAEVTARAIWELIAANKPGLYHLGGSERLSRWDIGQLVAAQFPHLHPRCEPVSIRSVEQKRPPDTSLDNSRIQRLLSFPLPKFSEWLKAHPSHA